MWKQTHHQIFLAQMHKTEANIMETVVKEVEAYCHKTWQETTFEDLLIETAMMFGEKERRLEEDQRRRRRHQALRRTVTGLQNRGLVEE